MHSFKRIILLKSDIPLVHGVMEMERFVKATHHYYIIVGLLWNVCSAGCLLGLYCKLHVMYSEYLTKRPLL